jgi:hypothetical protein
MRLRSDLPVTPLRAALWLLVALLFVGMALRPLLNQVVELHADEHASITTDGHGHEHDHGHDHDPSIDHEPATDPAHTQGEHGLLHQADSVTSAGIWANWVLPPRIPHRSLLPMPDPASIRSRHAATPFRPPIA